MTDDELIRELEEMYEHTMPCGGVGALNMPPCGSAATWTLDRRNPIHYGPDGGEPCDNTPHPTHYKCSECLAMWFGVMFEHMSENGGELVCDVCERWFYRITDFARYVPL